MIRPRTRAVVLSLLLCLLFAAGIQPAAAQEPPPAGDDAELLYMLGVLLSRNLGPLQLSADELERVQKGMADAVLGRTLEIDPAVQGPKVQAFVAARTQSAAAAEKERSAGFLTEAAAAEGATRTDSGLIYTEIAAGTGATPTATDTVTVHYRGTLRDGKVFDSSIDRGQPATFPLNRVIPCWTEGLQRMKTGGKARLVCPPEIAYGDQGAPPSIPPGAVLIFEVELMAIAESGEGSE